MPFATGEFSGVARFRRSCCSCQGEAMGFSRSADGMQRAALIQDLLEPCGLGVTLRTRHNDHPEQGGEIAAAPLSSIHSKTQKRAEHSLAQAATPNLNTSRDEIYASP